MIKSMMKIAFGCVIGITAYIVVTYSDISGIKMISTIGAFPALWIEILVVIGILKIAFHPERYDVHKEDYKTGDEK